MHEERKIILASGSPRRLELMQRIGFSPKVLKTDVIEERKEWESPQDYTERLAKEKAFAAVYKAQSSEEIWILSADTIVVLESDVLEKPVDEEDAKRMLGRMSGRFHEVITSFCWLNKKTLVFDVQSVIAKVEMIELSDAMIDAYVATGEPMDKAGAYGIQAIGATFIRGVVGSYFCVMGLPVCEVVESLKKLNGLTTYPFLPEPTT